MNSSNKINISNVHVNVISVNFYEIVFFRNKGTKILFIRKSSNQLFICSVCIIIFYNVHVHLD